jgi:hypothetical protein
MGGCVILAAAGLAALLLYYASQQPNPTRTQETIQIIVALGTIGVGLAGIALAFAGLVVGIRAQKNQGSKAE